MTPNALIKSSDLEAELPKQTSFRSQRLFHFLVASETTLPASSADVWRVLIDFEHYKNWNSFTQKAETEFTEGAPIYLEVHGLESKPLQRVEFIHSVIPERRICWGMRIGPLLTANRIQWIHPLTTDRTLYRTEDHISGILAPLVKILYGQKMQKGFDAVCSGLQKYFSQSSND